MRLIVCLIIAFATCYGCVNLQTSESSVRGCSQVGGVTTCDYKTVSSFDFPIAAGTCSKLNFTGSIDQSYHPTLPIEMFIQVLDAFLVVDQQNSFFSMGTQAGGDWAVCQCLDVFKTEYCYAYDASKVDYFCNQSDHCSDHFDSNRYPHTSFCSKDGPSDGCVFNSAWCGCAYDVPVGPTFFVAGNGAEHLYVTFRLDVYIGSTQQIGSPITYLLDGLNGFTLTNGGFSADVILQAYHVPDTGLSIGATVISTSRKVGPYLIPNVVLWGTPASCDTPFWYRTLSFATQGWVWDPVDYGLKTRTNLVSCASNSGSYSQTVNRLINTLVPSNAIDLKMNQFYSYRNITEFGVAPALLLNLVSTLSIQMVVTSNAKDVVSVETFATAVVSSAGSTFVCGSGTAGFWLAGTNSGDLGLATVVLYHDSNEYNIGEVLILPGFFNKTFTFPFADLNVTRSCLYSLVVSCGTFTPNCIEPPNPYNPNDNTPFSNGGSSSVAWWGWLLIAFGVVLAVIVLIVVAICCCKVALL